MAATAAAVMKNCDSCFFRQQLLCSLKVEGDLCPTYRPCDRAGGLCRCPVAEKQDTRPPLRPV